MMIRPSKDLSEIAMEFERSIPPFIRFLTHGLGPIEEAAEMVSYLLFEPEFCRALIELGYRDAMNQCEDITRFIKSYHESASGL
jgi:NTE family protein